MDAFIDIHHHILYGVDDGPISKPDMQKMLTAAHEDGIRIIIATPHIAPGIRPYSVEVFEARIEEAKQICQACNLDMEVCIGAEVLYTYQTERYFAEHRVPTIAGSNKVLIEFPIRIPYIEVEQAIQATLRCGIVPILAHVERYRCLMYKKQNYYRLKEKFDLFYQINCDCLLCGGHYSTKRVVDNLLKDGLVDFVATDAHNPVQRGCNLQEAYGYLKRIVGVEYADRLTNNHVSLEEFINL